MTRRPIVAQAGAGLIELAIKTGADEIAAAAVEREFVIQRCRQLVGERGVQTAQKIRRLGEQKWRDCRFASSAPLQWWVAGANTPSRSRRHVREGRRDRGRAVPGRGVMSGAGAQDLCRRSVRNSRFVDKIGNGVLPQPRYLSMSRKGRGRAIRPGGFCAPPDVTRAIDDGQQAPLGAGRTGLRASSRFMRVAASISRLARVSNAGGPVQPRLFGRELVLFDIGEAEASGIRSPGARQGSEAIASVPSVDNSPTTSFRRRARKTPASFKGVERQRQHSCRRSARLVFLEPGRPEATISRGLQPRQQCAPSAPASVEASRTVEGARRNVDGGQTRTRILGRGPPAGRGRPADWRGPAPAALLGRRPGVTSRDDIAP